MNFKLLAMKTIDFVSNLSVVAFGLAIFEGNWYGLVVGLFGLLTALVIILNYREKE